jgi:hypothetical protein
MKNSVNNCVHALEDTWDLGARGLSDCVKAVGETETTQENIQDWLELDEGDPGFLLLTEEEIAAMIFYNPFSSALSILLNVSCICFLSFLAFKATFCFINRDYLLQINPV